LKTIHTTITGQPLDIKNINNIHFNPNIELAHNFEHYKILYSNQYKVVLDRKKSYEYYKNKIDELAEHYNATDEKSEKIQNCSICLDVISKPTVILDCGHCYCKACFDNTYKTYKLCPTCRKPVNLQTLLTINTDTSPTKYGTKITKLLELVDVINDKFIIYTEFTNVIKVIEHVLTEQSTPFVIYKNYNDILEFKNNPHIKIMILSSANNASGLDLSFINNMVIFEPLRGEYNFRKEIEKQLIGRINRINQTKDMIVHKLIINNTIESELVV
jgi:SNF2 family DNA or RNA helicase